MTSCVFCRAFKQGSGGLRDSFTVHLDRGCRFNRTILVYVLNLVVCLLAADSANALDPHRQITQYVHETWSSKNGLPENDVQNFVQTADGYIWFSTENGLVRFDGVHFTAFDRNNTPELADDYIRMLVGDREGNLWIHTP